MEATALTLRGGNRALALRALLGLTGADYEKRICWVHVAYEGSWEGHPDGAFTLDDAAFASCVTAFDAQKNPAPVDYEHASVRDLPKAPAAGWVQKLEKRGKDLYALVEWTQAAADEIRSGAYRYCSGVFVFGKPDRKTGEPRDCVLHSIALTNTPFIDGQQPIALSQRISLSTGVGMEISREALMTALEQLEGDKFSEDQLKALIESVAKMAEAQDPKASAGDASSEEPADMPASADAPALADAPAVAAPLAAEPSPDMAADPSAMLAKFEELASKMGMDLSGLLAKLEEMAAAAPAEAPQPAALTQEVAALKATIKALSVRLEKHDAREAALARVRADEERKALDAEVDALVERGVVLRADIESWRALAHKDVASFRSLSETVKKAPAVPTGAEASAKTAPASKAFALSDSAEIVEVRKKLELMGYKDRAKQDEMILRVIPKTTAG